MGSLLTERADELRRDRSHGGSWMARRAVEAIAEVGAEPAASTEELLERLDAAGRELAASRRTMGAIAGAVARVLAGAHHSSHLPPDELGRLVQEEVRGLIAGRDRAAASIAIQLRPFLTEAFVLTHSASATVREAVLQTPPELLICTVSEPFGEGRSLADELASAGVAVEVVEDAEAEGVLERASLFLIGADTVYRDGSVCNKTGTRTLAEAAARNGVPTIVASEVIKLAPIDAPEAIEDEQFDVTPAELVDQIVTEEGAYPSDEIRTLIDRTPFLSEGYALLRGGPLR